jgi:hypothetical protein
VPLAELRRIRVASTPFDGSQEPTHESPAVSHRHSETLQFAGITLTAVGSLVLLPVGLGAISSSSFLYYAWPLAAASGMLLGVGIPMWVIGGRQEEQATVSVGAAPGRGWQGRLSVRF